MSAEYLNYAGWMNLPPPPYLGTGGQLYMLSFAADLTACQGYLDRSYNQVAGRNQFRVMIDRVFLLMLKSEAIFVQQAPFSGKGGVPEADLGLWLLVGSYGDDMACPDSIGWVPAYLLVDSGYAIAAGREIWGFPKYQATLTWPTTFPSPGPFAASALVIAESSPSAIASTQQILLLQGTNLVPLERPDSAVEAFARICTDADRDLLDFLTNRTGPREFLGSVGEIPFPFPVPVFYLKQVRSADGSSIAVEQVLLSGPLVVTEMQNIGLILGDWELQLAAVDSLPFVSDLGLGDPDDGTVTLKTSIAFVAEVEYTIDAAQPMTDL